MSETTGWTIVSTYTRAQALADGVLVKARADLAAQAGWKHHVAYTAAAHQVAIAWSAQRQAHSDHDELGREWDVLNMAAGAARRAHPSTDRAAFVVIVVPVEEGSATRIGVDMVAHIGPGDTPKPVVTIMLPGQD